IPEGVTEVGMGLLAFTESRSSAMTIPQSVKTIYKYLFSEDTAGVLALQDVYYLGSRKQLSELRLVTDWGEDEWGIPPLKSHITLHCAPTPAEKTLVLPSGTRTIEDQAFYGIKAEEVVIPSGATGIGSEAFAGNADLIIARIPSSVTQIADNAFTGCSPYLLIIGESGSVAETYATSHNLSFEKAN
ncbi:MAG: leucine-rich repeat protein, partial [Clostridia bacterium]|nr:leucine-rich repeat protein [Clostridia bacterium]